MNSSDPEKLREVKRVLEISDILDIIRTCPSEFFIYSVILSEFKNVFNPHCPANLLFSSIIRSYSCLFMTRVFTRSDPKIIQNFHALIHFCCPENHVNCVIIVYIQGAPHQTVNIGFGLGHIRLQHLAQVNTHQTETVALGLRHIRVKHFRMLISVLVLNFIMKSVSL